MTPNVGDPAPLFTLPTQRGVPVRLSEVLTHGAALIAFPGRVDSARPGGVSAAGAGAAAAAAPAPAPADRRVLALARIHDRLREACIQLLVIVPNPREDAKRYVEETGTPFHLLCDDGEVATRYGVRRRVTLRRDTHPALFAVNGDGRIGYRLLETWDERSPALVEAIEYLSQAQATARLREIKITGQGGR
jgi:peroxiredoxin